MPFIDLYTSAGNKSFGSTKHAGYQMRVNPSVEYLKIVRKLWKGNLIIKGIGNALDLGKIEACNPDAIWVSNHAGRQFESGVASVKSL